MDSEEYTNLYRINQSIGACLVGYPGMLNSLNVLVSFSIVV